MKGYETKYSIIKMAKILGVSRSGYYAWERRKSYKKEGKDLKLAELIRGIFNEYLRRYRSPRIW